MRLSDIHGPVIRQAVRRQPPSFNTKDISTDGDVRRAHALFEVEKS